MVTRDVWTFDDAEMNDFRDGVISMEDEERDDKQKIFQLVYGDASGVLMDVIDLDGDVVHTAYVNKNFIGITRCAMRITRKNKVSWWWVKNNAHVTCIGCLGETS